MSGRYRHSKEEFWACDIRQPTSAKPMGYSTFFPQLADEVDFVCLLGGLQGHLEEERHGLFHHPDSVPFNGLRNK